MADNALTPLQPEISAVFSHLQRIEERARSLAEIDPEQRLLAFELLGEGLAIAVLTYLPPPIQMELLQSMDAAALIPVLEAMGPEDRQQLLAGLPTEAIDGLIAKLHEEFQAAVHELLNIPQLPTASFTDDSNDDYPDWWEIDDCGD
jgi:Mg/Co/Ni transporter MgtE